MNFVVIRAVAAITLVLAAIPLFIVWIHGLSDPENNKMIHMTDEEIGW